MPVTFENSKLGRVGLKSHEECRVRRVWSPRESIMHSEHYTYCYTNKTKQHGHRRGGGVESPVPDA